MQICKFWCSLSKCCVTQIWFGIVFTTIFIVYLCKLIWSVPNPITTPQHWLCGIFIAILWKSRTHLNAEYRIGRKFETQFYFKFCSTCNFSPKIKFYVSLFNYSWSNFIKITFKNDFQYISDWKGPRNSCELSKLAIKTNEIRKSSKFCLSATFLTPLSSRWAQKQSLVPIFPAWKLSDLSYLW